MLDFPSLQSRAEGVGQSSPIPEDKDPLSTVRGSHPFSRKHTPFRIEPCVGQAVEDFPEPRGEQPSNVFQEHECGLHVANNSEYVGPHPPLVLVTQLLPGHGDGLTVVDDTPGDDVGFVLVDG